jgi:hypothetical protein
MFVMLMCGMLERAPGNEHFIDEMLQIHQLLNSGSQYYILKMDHNSKNPDTVR